MSLALSTLLFEWRRYMAAVMALALSGLLVLAMTGVFIGIGKGFTAQIERSRADVIIMQPGAKSLIGGPSGVPRRFIPLVYNNPEVVEVQPLDGAGGTFQSVKNVDPDPVPGRPGQDGCTPSGLRPGQHHRHHAGRRHYPD
jgi:putative ABC transport system permease protein